LNCQDAKNAKRNREGKIGILYSFVFLGVLAVHERSVFTAQGIVKRGTIEQRIIAPAG
jgi:hypothetical protein